MLVSRGAVTFAGTVSEIVVGQRRLESSDQRGGAAGAPAPQDCRALLEACANVPMG
jgi:hypothetical protein